MKTSTALRLGLFAFGAVGACAWAPAAVADDGTQTTLGAQADVGGGQMWTVTGLQPSADSIPFQAAGTLWEATATAAPVGGGHPGGAGFTARAGAGQLPGVVAGSTANRVNPPLFRGRHNHGQAVFRRRRPGPEQRCLQLQWS